MKIIFRAIFWHIFPFGWFFSLGGVVLLYISLLSFYPLFFNKIETGIGEVIRINIPKNGNYENGGDSDNFVMVVVRLNNGKIIGCGDTSDNVNQENIGNIVSVRYEKSDLNPSSMYNKILIMKGRKVNNYYGQSELITMVLFLWGSLFLYIAFRDLKSQYVKQLKKILVIILSCVSFFAKSQQQPQRCVDGIQLNMRVKENSFKVYQYLPEVRSGMIFTNQLQVKNLFPEELMSSILCANSQQWVNYNEIEPNEISFDKIQKINLSDRSKNYFDLLQKIEFSANGSD